VLGQASRDYGRNDRTSFLQSNVNSNVRKGFGWKSKKPECQVIQAGKCGRKNIEFKKGDTK
jgi:hypothetical protein